jgi:hypothetical protein
LIIIQYKKNSSKKELYHALGESRQEKDDCVGVLAAEAAKTPTRWISPANALFLINQFF